MAGFHLFLISLLLLSAAAAGGGHGSPKVPALIVFGDSTVDTGNNNYISTPFAGNHPPYGRILDGGAPTGRFSNGLLVPDFLVSVLGIKTRLPPFLDPALSDDDMATGVNFASAGSGYDDVTSAISGVIPMSEQLEMFKAYLARLQRTKGKKGAARIVNRAVVLFSAGTNDFVINYYDTPARRIQFSIDEYQDFILEKVGNVIKEVYDLGGRRIAVAGLPPVGCTPVQMTSRLRVQSERACVDEENADAVVYNAKLQVALAELSLLLPGSRIVYVNVYDPLLDISARPQKYGLEETKWGCCGSGYVESGPLCNRFSPICPDESKYMFFDAIHPTEDVYRILTDYIVEAVMPKLF